MKAAGKAATFTFLPVSAEWLIIPIFRRTGDGCSLWRWAVAGTFCPAESFHFREVPTSASLVLAIAGVFPALGPLTAIGCTSMHGLTIFISGGSAFRAEKPSKSLL